MPQQVEYEQQITAVLQQHTLTSVITRPQQTQNVARAEVAPPCGRQRAAQTGQNYREWEIGYKPGFSNRLLVSLEHLHVVHVGLPVLHVAAVVGRQHPHVVVRPGHGPDRTIVGLQGEDGEGGR